MRSADAPAGSLAETVLRFGRALRRAGLSVGPAAIVDALAALEAVGLTTRADFYWTLHAVFVTRREDRDVFRETFDLFFRRPGRVEALIALRSPVAPARPAERPRPGAARAREAVLSDAKPRAPEPGTGIDARLSLSGREVLRRKDFAQMSAAELAEAKAALARLAMPDDRVATRRRVAARRGRIDPRRTLRTSLRLGGGILVPVLRAPASIAPPIVALCDISGSMSEYSRLLLHFLHALSARRRVTAFLFGTRLTNVTRPLRLKDPDAALDACSGAVADWAGGTRIGAALHAFNRDWSRRVLGQRATVLLITDGLERPAAEESRQDSLAELAAETARLRRSCRKLVWLNPLLRFDGFEPKAGGIRAMLPHVDEFRPIHSLAAVADLAAALSADAPRSPARVPLPLAGRG